MTENRAPKTQYRNPKAHPGADKLPWALRGGIAPFKAGLVAVVVIAVATWFAFSKQNPFERHFEVQAVFENSNLLQPRSPVRIAGIDIGQVTTVGRYRNTKYSVVTMRIQKNGLPIHGDATAKIRPRIFLEGNFYIDLKPGTPSAPALANRGIIPVAHTSRPVQLDQVLAALDTPTRKALGATLSGFGAALDTRGSAAEDAAQDPSVRGLTGAQALNKTLHSSPQALRDSAVVNQALLGLHPGDLAATVRGFARASAGLNRNQIALRALVPEFDATMGALAAQAPALTRTVPLLGPTAANANRGFGALLAALPATRRFARELV